MEVPVNIKPDMLEIHESVKRVRTVFASIDEFGLAERIERGNLR